MGYKNPINWAHRAHIFFELQINLVYTPIRDVTVLLDCSASDETRFSSARKSCKKEISGWLDISPPIIKLVQAWHQLL